MYNYIYTHTNTQVYTPHIWAYKGNIYIYNTYTPKRIKTPIYPIKKAIQGTYKVQGYAHPKK